MSRLSKIARATRLSEPNDEKIVCITEGRRVQTRTDGGCFEWRIERLSVEDAAHAIAGREYIDCGTDGSPWVGVYV